MFRPGLNGSEEVVETNSTSGALHQAARQPGRSVPPSRSAVIETEVQTTLPATRIGAKGRRGLSNPP
jgi:hypothetical protein